MSSAELIKMYGSGLDPYQLEGGVWLEHAPVLINEDFNFALAMGMEGIGAGIAAAQRTADNEKKAKALEGVQLSTQTLARLEELRRRGAHAFFVLWGQEKVVLKFVVEEGVGCGGKRKKPRVEEGKERTLEEWEGGEHLARATASSPFGVDIALGDP